MKQIEKRTPEILLLDLGLPKLDGWGVLRHLNHNDYRDIIKIVISTTNDANAGMRAAKLGAVDYISKTFFYETAVAKIVSALTDGGPNNYNSAIQKRLIQNLDDLNRLSPELEFDDEFSAKVKDLEAAVKRQKELDVDEIKDGVIAVETVLAGAGGNLVAEGILAAIKLLLG